jgi:hypothetical protein
LYPRRWGARIRRDRLFCVPACALVLLCGAPVRGQEGQAAPRADGYEVARVHFERGMDHYRGHRYREAIREFQLSVTRVPNADIWFNMARAYEQLDEAAQAVDHYRLYLRDRVDAPDAEEVQARIARLYERATSTGRPRSGQPVGSLAIAASDPGLLLLVDGRSVGPTPIDRVVELRPGRHRVEASKEGWIPLRSEVEIHPNAVSAAYVDLRPRTRPAHATRHRPWTFVAAVGSAAALIAGGMLSLEALDRRGSGDRGTAQDLEVGSAIALGSGLVLAMGATLLYFVEGDSDEPSPRSLALADRGASRSELAR